MIDWQIRFGDLLVIGSLIGSILYYAFQSGKFTQSILTMKQDIIELNEFAKSMGKTLTQMAVQHSRLDAQAERLNVLDKRIEDLRHGDGFIAGRRGIEREHP